MPITRIGAAKVLQTERKSKKNEDFFVGDQKGDKVRKVEERRQEGWKNVRQFGIYCNFTVKSG